MADHCGITSQFGKERLYPFMVEFHIDALENLRENRVNDHQSGKPEQIGWHHDRQIKQLCNAGKADQQGCNHDQQR